MIVDFHTHIFSPKIKDQRDDYLKRDPCLSRLYSSPKAKIATAEDIIQSMDESGVDVSVILNGGWVSQDFCKETNDYILDAVARYPKRLVGFCAIQPKAGDLALAEIERCANAGARGIGELRPDDQGFDLGDIEIMAPIVESLRKYSLIFLTHASEPVGHIYQGKGSVTPGAIYPFICNFPDIRIVCAHWGGGLPFYGLMPEVASALTNTFFDTAASPFLYRPQIYGSISAVIGADKILFGTDYPLLSQKRVMAEIESTELPAKSKAMILGDNAKKLLQIS